LDEYVGYIGDSNTKCFSASELARRSPPTSKVL
jgi:hypothetical protein